MGFRQFDRDTRPADIIAALDDAGAVLVKGLADPSTIDAVREQLRVPREQRAPLTPFTLLPENELFAASPGALDLVGHAGALSIADAVLLRHSSSYQLGSANAIVIAAGADERPLDADTAAYPLRVTGLEWGMSAVWALDDVSAETGAPTLIPGSHRWDIMRLPDEKNTVCIAMPKGSVLFCMGWTLRGWASNRSSSPSHYLVNRYTLGWLRTEVNHALALPTEVTAKYPENIKRLLGYASYENGRLGWHPRQPS